jgi:peptidoglycan/LPS O-acetylase OafA/YrhL
MERVAALDLLRGMAALSVAIPHFIMLSSTADWAEIVSVLAVEVFFVLSGFVLGPQILRCLRSGQAGDLGVFLARRWMRTIPPYLFALALFSVIVGHIEVADFARYALYVENLFAQHNANDYFPVAWSLSIEEWFYITFLSLLMAAAWCFRTSRDWFAVCIALCFVGAITLLRSLYGDLNDWGANVRRIVLFRIDSIAYGFLFFMFVRSCAGIAAGWRASVFNPRGAAVMFLVAASLAGVLTWRIETIHSHLAETLFPFAAAGFGISSILAAYSARRIFLHSVPVTQCCAFLGRVSYSLYLFHLSVAVTIAPYLAGLSVAVQMTVYLVACVALSAVFYHIFERPILAMRPNYRWSDHAAAIDARAKSVTQSSHP